MKTKLYFIFICSLLSAGLHLYLSSRSYALAEGRVEGATICHINDSVNCDNVLTSPYAEPAGIPVSNWGFAVNAVMALLALILLAVGVEKPSLWRTTLLAFAVLSAGASIVMFVISTFVIHVLCPFCLILYLLSFIVLICSLLTVKKQGMFATLSENPWFFPGAFSLCLFTGVLSHLTFMNLYDSKSIGQAVKIHTADWLSAPLKHTQKKPLLTAGPSSSSGQADLTVTEFADFLCSHCRNSHYILKIFKASHPQVRVEYFSFPLDRCEGQRVSCALTRAVYCAETQNQGWNMHNLVFENQKKFIPLKDNTQAFKILRDLGSHLQINWDRWSECTASSVAFAVVKAQMKAGQDMGITGTPTLFVNKKKLPHRYFTKTIKNIQNHLKQKK